METDPSTQQEEKTSYTKAELEEIVTQDRLRMTQQLAHAFFGKQWFMEALAHTKSLVEQGAFPEEAHKVGLQIQYLFMVDNGLWKPKEPPKKEEPPK